MFSQGVVHTSTPPDSSLRLTLVLVCVCVCVMAAGSDNGLKRSRRDARIRLAGFIHLISQNDSILL